MNPPSDPDRTVNLSAPAEEALPAGARMGEFEVTSVIGQGGFGIVYLAYDHSLERKVALKEFMPSDLARRTDEGAVTVKSQRYAETFGAALRSFVNEARLLAQFDHPSLVKVYRFWEANGTAYMVMPFYEGLTLKQTLRGLEQPPDEAWLKALLIPLLNALEVMHAHHCYHRDIAPDNILMLTGGAPLLLDFGAARRVIGDAAHALTVILKPGYAPVEQYGESPDLQQGAWTDLYALASVLHYAIMGRPPAPAVARMMSDPQVPLVQAAAGRYSATFLSGIDAALCVQPAGRPPDVARFRDALGFGARKNRVPDAPDRRASPRGDRPDRRASPRGGGADADRTQPVPSELGTFDRSLSSRSERRADPTQSPRSEPRTSHQRGSPASAPASPAPTAEENAQLEKLLAGYIGPLARIIISRARKSAQNHDDFLDALAAAIDDEESRSSFLRAAERLGR